MDVGDTMRGLIEEDKVRQMTVDTIVDTGAWTLVINEETRTKLGLLDQGMGEATLADGQKGEYPMAGPLEIWWKKGILSNLSPCPPCSPCLRESLFIISLRLCASA